MSSHQSGFRSGELSGGAEALSAFASAAQKGLEAGRQNLVSVLRSSGLEEAAKAALALYPEGRPGGRLVKP